MAHASQGTISVEFSDGRTTLYFVPVQDYSNKHGKKKLAVFVQLGDGNGAVDAIVREYKDDVGVKIAVLGDELKDAVRGAWRSTKVEVQVRPAREREVDAAVEEPAAAGAVAVAQPAPLVLTGIRIPAR